MALQIGHVTLGGVQFTSDPPEVTVERPARGTKLPLIDGGLYEDATAKGAAARIRLSSGENQVMSAAVKTAIEAMAGQPEAMFQYTDYAGLSVTVVVERFTPKPTFIPDRAGGLYYTYELELAVVGTAQDLGEVTLGGVTFTVDPEEITVDRPPRLSYLQTIGGGLYQDFGRIGSDTRIRLSSGTDQLLSETVKAAIEEMAAEKGVAWPYSDPTGLSANVVILRFAPKKTFFRGGGSGDLYYAYELELAVVE
jgi:hypothetical protein